LQKWEDGVAVLITLSGPLISSSVLNSMNKAHFSIFSPLCTFSAYAACRLSGVHI
jgi:hypothetical protein